MIEVVSRRHPSAVKTVVCKNCGAELRYTKSDTIEEWRKDYTGYADKYIYITCPDCLTKIYLSS